MQKYTTEKTPTSIDTKKESTNPAPFPLSPVPLYQSFLLGHAEPAKRKIIPRHAECMNTQPPHTRITDADIERIASAAAAKAADEAVSRVFRSLGLDLDDATHITAWHADINWLRRARTGSGQMTWKVATSVIASIVTAISFAVWQLFQSGSPPAP